MNKKMIIILPSIVLLFPLVSVAQTANTTQVDSATGYESERIKGVANFLLERANANFMYIFESNLQKNNYFAHYFPETFSYAESGHLRTLLRSGGNIWKDSITRDMDCIVDQTTSTIVRKTSMYISGFADHYNFLLQYMSIEIEGKDYALNAIPLDASPNVRNIINEFYLYTEKEFSSELNESAQQLITRVENGLTAQGKEGNDDKEDKKSRGNVCINNPVPVNEDMDALDDQFLSLKASAEKIKKLVDVFRKYRDQLKLNEDQVLALLRYNAADIQLEQNKQQRIDESFTDFSNRTRNLRAEVEQKKQHLKELNLKIEKVASDHEQLSRLIISLYGEQAYQNAGENLSVVLKKSLPDGADSIIIGFRSRFNNYIEYYFDIRDELEQLKGQCTDNEHCHYNYTVRIIGIERILQAAIDHDVFAFRGSFDAERFNQFMRYMLFFAEISDARSAGTVEALLEEVTFPPVSFGKKRSVGEERWLITSYLGGAMGQERSPDGGADGFTGLFAPVGLEYTFKRHGGKSHSIMLSPVDFANPVNLELQDREESVKFSDIFVPGIYYSFGFKDLPLTVGFGVNRGKTLKSDYGNETRWLIFLSFDMPLLTVY